MGECPLCGVVHPFVCRFINVKAEQLGAFMKEKVFELRIEEWKRCEWMLRGRGGIPGMGIVGDDKGGET